MNDSPEQRGERPPAAENAGKWVINPEWVAMLEKDLAEARRQRDEWLWCYTLIVGVLDGQPGWETAKEFADFGNGLVPLPSVAKAKKARRALEKTLE